MENKEQKLSTRELWGKLFKASTVDVYFETTGEGQHFPTFPEYITSLCRTKREKAESVIRRGQIESSFGHRLFHGTRKPSRDTILQLAFGLELDADGTQKLLKVARATALHPRVKRDAIIAYCLHHHETLMQTQQLLFEYNLPLIGGKRGEK